MERKVEEEMSLKLPQKDILNIWQVNSDLVWDRGTGGGREIQGQTLYNRLQQQTFVLIFLEHFKEIVA